MSRTEKLNAFIKEFKNSEIWRAMRDTVENSPWHREANVAVHTEMVMQEYLDKFYKSSSEAENVVSLLALLMHDIGKPRAEEVLEKKDNPGEFYRRYANHEQDSAALFMELYVTSSVIQEIISPLEARAVRWIIEHHLPYGLKDKKKRQSLAISTHCTLAEAGLSYNVFFSCLRSDAAGRISDDHQKKLADVESWINEFSLVSTEHHTVKSARTLYMLIGPPGSGKSTYVREHAGPGDQLFSLDECRINFFVKSAVLDCQPKSDKDQYRQAWAYAEENSEEFTKYIQSVLKAVFANKQGNIFIDNTNLSKKRRTQYVDLARRNMMAVHGVEFWNPLAVLIARQSTRPDNCVPADAVTTQFYSASSAWVGAEVDTVQIITGA
jgi:predicted kinase